MKPNLPKALFSGLLISCLVLASSIICLFKSGVGAVIDTALLSLCVLAALRGATAANVALSDLFARAFISGASTVAAYLAVLLLNNGTLSTRQYFIFVLVMSVSAIAGVLFFSAVGGFFARQGYAFPQLAPRLAVLASPGSDPKKNARLFGSAAFSALYAFVCRRLSLREFKAPGVAIPVFSNSLLYVSTGYFIGYRTWLKMLLGFGYSLVIFLLCPAASFSEHIVNPYIYSVVLAFSLVNGGFAVWGTIRKIKLPAAHQARLRGNAFAGCVLAALLAFYGALFGLEPTLAGLPFWVILILLLLTIVSSLSTAIGVAETGFWFSTLDDVLPIVLIALAQIRDLPSIIFALAGFTSFEMAGIYYVINCRVGEKFSLPKRTVTCASAVSCVCASAFAVALVRLLSMAYPLGEAEYPVPNAKVLEVTIHGLIEALTRLTLPAYLNLPVFAAAALLCVLLKKRKISPMTIIGGILLPFGAFTALGVGALLSYLLRGRQTKPSEVFSGFAIGEGLASTVLAFLRAG